MHRIPRVLFPMATCLALMLSTDLCLAVSDCVYLGVNFSDGAVSCQSGHQFKCSDGTWQSLDIVCTEAPAEPSLENPADCSCTLEEMVGCNQLGQTCCVSILSGKCVRSCCPNK